MPLPFMAEIDGDECDDRFQSEIQIFRITSIVFSFFFFSFSSSCCYRVCQCQCQCRHSRIKKFNYATNYKSIFHLVISIVSLRIRIIVSSLFLWQLFSISITVRILPRDDVLCVVLSIGKAIALRSAILFTREQWYICHVLFDEFDSLAAQQSFVKKYFLFWPFTWVYNFHFATVQQLLAKNHVQDATWLSSILVDKHRNTLKEVF